MAFKNVELKKKVNGTLYELNPKTDSSVVQYGNGLSVKDVLDAYTESIDDMEAVVGDNTSGLVKDVSDLKTTVGNSSSGLVKDVADVSSDVSAFDTRIDSLETAVGGVSSGLVKDVADLDDEINNSTTGLSTRVGALEDSAVDMTGATGSAAGKHGFVPAPKAGDQAKFLNGAGQWSTPANTTYGEASTAAAGLMSATDKAKLGSIAASANNYSHPNYTSKAAGLYKVAVDGTGHVSGTTAVAKADITGLGIPGSDTTYAAATTAANGLMASSMVTKLNGIESGANKYTHPSHTAHASGLYKVTVDASGHVSAAAAVEKSDITALGIPGEGSTYPAASTAVEGLMSTADKAKLDSIAASANKYSHPGYTSRAAGLYKVTVDATGHVSSAAAVAKSDITSLGIPGSDTTYAAATTDANGLMTSSMVSKLNGIAEGANKYTHPGYTSQASGLYKVGVDSTGHVSSVAAVEKDDITALGIPETNTTYAAATTAANGLMASSMVTKLNGIESGANKYTHPGHTSYDSGLYKVAVDSTGHVSSATAVGKSDITALGIPGSDTTYGAATTAVAGLMAASMVTKLNGIASGANAYTHPSHTSHASGLYKVGVDSSGHVSSATAATKDDITALGIPGSDTTYGTASTAANGLMASSMVEKLNGIAAGANAYSHPGYTARSSGFYKVTVDGTGHVSAVAAVGKSDITGLGIPGSDTTYDAATTAAAGLMSASDKTKLNGIADGANKYTHPSYTSKAAGLYKVAVDASGHVSGTTAVAKGDITGLGIPGSDTTYAAATTAAAGLMSTAMVSKLNGIANGANAYTHPGYTSYASGLYKVTVDATGHVSSVVAAAKADITGLGIPGSNTTYANATSAAAGLMTAAQFNKLESIAASANNYTYTHPSHTAHANGLYKVTVDSSGHVSSAAAVTKDDITALGIPETNTTYGDASTSSKGLMTTAMVSKLNGIADNANKYTHPSYTSKAAGLYKVSVDGSGHVNGTTAVAKSDITGLGIPGSDTTYGTASTAVAGLMSTAMVEKLNGIAAGANKYSHPGYTSHASGFYKVTVDATGHVSGTAAVGKSDITGLGIPGSDTTYAAATTAANGLMTAAMVTKLNGIATGANAYSHPGHTSYASGLYKVTVDSSGHVSSATAVAKADITGLGIPGSNTTYGAATTAAAGLMSADQVKKLDSIAASANNYTYTHPSYTSKASGLYKVTVDASGHVSATAAVAKSDITGLGIPGSNTTYGAATSAASGLMTADQYKKLDSIAASANNYSHPAYTSKAAGLYKLTVDATGHVSGTTAVAKADITGLGIPGSNTTYAEATTAVAGLMSTAMVSKLNGIATGANKYTHPSYTSKAAGFYKMTVDGTGHVSGTTAVAQSDITGLGIATTAVASTSAKGLVQIGSNLTVSNGVVSLTATNVSAALGYEPIGASYDSATSAIVFGLQTAS